MLDVSHLNAIVLVFGMPGCGACEEYIPRLKLRAQALHEEYRTVVIDEASGTKRKSKVKVGMLPIFIYDVESEDLELQKLADQYEIKAMPTTIVLIRPQGALRLEGAIADGHIDHILKQAAEYV